MSEPLKYILIGVIAYLLGSISTGLIVAKLTGGPDLRKVGSKNTGASNALRTMGTRDGLIVFLGDYAKAALACGIGWWISGKLEGAMLAGLCVVIGHNWPVFFEFRGGKGVASSIAVMMVCFPVPALLCYALGIALIAIWRYISLGSLSVLLSYALMVTFLVSGGNWLIIAWVWVLAIMCFIRHRENIKRLLHGNERKIGEKVSK
jgi:glycerol-3-phosphate acyltransferase PlsY